MFLKRRTKDRKKHINLSPLFICTNYQHKIQMRLNKILNYIHSFKRIKRLKTNPPQPDDTQADSVLFFLFHKTKIKRLKYRPSLLCTIPHIILIVQSWVFTAWEKESFFLSSAVTRRWPPPSPWSSNVAHVCGGYMSGSLPDNAMKWGGGVRITIGHCCLAGLPVRLLYCWNREHQISRCEESLSPHGSLLKLA